MKCYCMLLSAVFFISCGDTEKYASPISESELQTKLDSLFQTVVDPSDPGAALLVVDNGRMVVGKGFGMRDVSNQLPITDSTNLRMASVSKQFTALCILLLVEKDSISLSDDVYTYLPNDIFRGIKVENLLNHTSGLPDYYEFFMNNWDTTQILQNKDVLEWLATGPDLVFNPGEKWEYSNTAYLMLALIVEKVSGQEFSSFAKNELFEKIGMKATHYFNLSDPVHIPQRAFCYERDSSGGFTRVDGFFMNGVMGDGAVYTSIRDYFAYDQALRTESILSESLHPVIFKPSSEYQNDDKKGFYAMGWNVTDTTASHSGGWYGTNTYVKRFLNLPVTYAIFMNRGTLWETDLVQQTEQLVVRYMNGKYYNQKNNK